MEQLEYADVEDVVDARVVRQLKLVDDIADVGQHLKGAGVAGASLPRRMGRRDSSGLCSTYSHTQSPGANSSS